MKLFITGDFCPINRADVSVGTTKELLSDGLKMVVQEADIVITNLECPLTINETPIFKTGPTLRADPRNVSLLTKNKFNLVTLANNHIMDYGSEGLKETLLHLKNNKIDYVGAGKSSDEIGIIYKTRGDLTIALINVCENEWSTQEIAGYKAYGLSEIDMFYLIHKAKTQADKVIVIHHGGHEMYNLPSPRLKTTFRFFVDCGADAIINHHTHCVGGFEVYRNAPIFYSLGNFVFDKTHQRNSIWNYGMAVTLNCTKEKITFERHYFEQFNEEPLVKEIKEQSLPYNLAEINKTIENDKLLNEAFERFVYKKMNLYSSYLEPIKSRYILALINRKIIPSFWNKKKRRTFQNLINCESHRDILFRILYEENKNHKL